MDYNGKFTAIQSTRSLCCLGAVRRTASFPMTSVQKQAKVFLPKTSRDLILGTLKTKIIK